MSLLNVKETIDKYGSFRDLWECDCEGYIHYVKGEMNIMRHNDKFLQTILGKRLRSSYLNHLNEDNPFSERK